MAPKDTTPEHCHLSLYHGWSVWPTECGRSHDDKRLQLLSWALNFSLSHGTLSGEANSYVLSLGRGLSDEKLKIWPRVSMELKATT